MTKSPNTAQPPELTADAVREITSRFHDRRVLVVGDVMLDEYLVGDVRRISPEAPVPVVDITHRVHRPGGAANVASNIASLSGSPILLGLVGNDESAPCLRSVLKSCGVSPDELVTASQRPTITKTRIVSGQQQIVRLDRELTTPLNLSEAEAILAAFNHHVTEVDVCLLSDYAKGLLTLEICREIIARARQLRKPIIVDPKGSSFVKYAGCSVITPNLREAEMATGQVVQSESDLFRSAAELQASLGETAVLVTRGSDGMTLFRANTDVLHAPALAREVFDVTGAGDTVVGTLALALASGATLEEAVLIANLAASIAVQKTGTATVSLLELMAAANVPEVLLESAHQKRGASRSFQSIATQPLATQ